MDIGRTANGSATNFHVGAVLTLRRTRPRVMVPREI